MCFEHRRASRQKTVPFCNLTIYPFQGVLQHMAPLLKKRKTTWINLNQSSSHSAFKTRDMVHSEGHRHLFLSSKGTFRPGAKVINSSTAPRRAGKIQHSLNQLQLMWIIILPITDPGGLVYVYLHEWMICMVNVGKYIPYVDGGSTIFFSNTFWSHILVVKGRRHVSRRGFPEENFVVFFLRPKAQGSNFHPKGFAFRILIVLLRRIYGCFRGVGNNCALPRDEIHHCHKNCRRWRADKQGELQMCGLFDVDLYVYISVYIPHSLEVKHPPEFV